MNTWIYVFDEFKPVDIDTGKLFRLVEEDPLKLFGIVREIRLMTLRRLEM